MTKLKFSPEDIFHLSDLEKNPDYCKIILRRFQKIHDEWVKQNVVQPDERPKTEFRGKELIKLKFEAEDFLSLNDDGKLDAKIAQAKFEEWYWSNIHCALDVFCTEQIDGNKLFFTSSGSEHSTHTATLINIQKIKKNYLKEVT